MEELVPADHRIQVREPIVGRIPGGGVRDQRLRLEGMAHDFARLFEGLEVAQSQRLHDHVADRRGVGGAHDQGAPQGIGDEMV